MRTRDFAFVSLCYGRSGEEICTGYAMAASGRMQYDYKQTNNTLTAGVPQGLHILVYPSPFLSSLLHELQADGKSHRNCHHGYRPAKVWQ